MSRRDVILNIDEPSFGQPGFAKFCLIFPINRIYFYLYFLIIVRSRL